MVRRLVTDGSPEHHCHALGCKSACPPEYLMCGHHWRMVPMPLKRNVYRHYRAGQCEDMQFTGRWLVAASHAIAHVGVMTGVITEEQAYQYILRAEKSAEKMEGPCL